LRVEFLWILRKEFREPYKGSSQIIRNLDKYYAVSFTSLPLHKNLKARVGGKEGEAIVIIFVDRLAAWATQIMKLLIEKRVKLERIVVDKLNKAVLHELIHIFSGEYGDVDSEIRVMKAVEVLVGPLRIYERLAGFILSTQDFWRRLAST